MATMLSDYNNMNCEGADDARGLRLLYPEIESDLRDHPVRTVLSMDFGVSLFRFIAPGGVLLTPESIYEKLAKGILRYKRDWDSVPYQDKRDVICKLRSMVRTGKTVLGVAMTAAKLLVLLA